MASRISRSSSMPPDVPDPVEEFEAEDAETQQTFDDFKAWLENAASDPNSPGPSQGPVASATAIDPVVTEDIPVIPCWVCKKSPCGTPRLLLS